MEDNPPSTFFDGTVLGSNLVATSNSLHTGNKPSNAKVNQLVKAAEKYTLANHLFWGLWGFISSYVNKIDFDYKEYGRKRFQQYWIRKPTLLDSPSIVSLDETVNGLLPSFT
ncbi:hypothetical protein JHK87_016395 [Glycine soja]|nr:hypothetical protein JHK87_016395 [Glycine soja]KAG5047096.1 hypothetical protein JHK86_016502 [Glycine max]